MISLSWLICPKNLQGSASWEQGQSHKGGGGEDQERREQGRQETPQSKRRAQPESGLHLLMQASSKIGSESCFGGLWHLSGGLVLHLSFRSTEKETRGQGQEDSSVPSSFLQVHGEHLWFSDLTHQGPPTLTAPVSLLPCGLPGGPLEVLFPVALKYRDGRRLTLIPDIHRLPMGPSHALPSGHPQH